MFEDAKKALIDASVSSSIYIGCDSIRFKKNGRFFAKYTTAVILHMDSCHGGKIFYRSEVLPDFGNVKQRMLTETQYAIEAAQEIRPIRDDLHMEVHLDLNGSPKHKSNVAVKEALGWVRGTLGLDAKIKPHSWAATHAADHCVRGKLDG